MEEIDVKELFKVLIKKLYVIIIVTIIGAAIGFAYSKYGVKPMYKSTTSFVLSKATGQDSIQAGAITQSDVTLNQKLVSTYSEIIKSKALAKQVITNLGLNMSQSEFMSNISVSAKDDTELILITVSNRDPELAASIANSLVEVFKDKITEVYKIENLAIIDVAEPSKTPYNMGTTKNTVLFAMVGLVLSCGIIFLIFYFDNTVKRQDQIEELLGIPVIASIVKYDEGMEGKKAYGN